jgi:hypothetical protein
MTVVGGLVVVGCSVQLTAPYSSDIELEAGDLQSDFLKFAAGMQMVAGTPRGFYDEHSAQYGDFEARLTVLRMRSESLPGGLPCGRTLNAAKKAAVPMADQIQTAIAGATTDSDNASCITILIKLAQANMELLRTQHHDRCAPTAKPVLCTTLFGAPPIFNVFLAGPNQAPLVSAVAITLNELVGAERDMKPANLR